MPIENGGFEEAGARAGEARAWRLRAVVRATELAAFGDPAVAHETFEWLELQRVLVPGGIVRARFGAAPAEGFASWAIGAALVLADIATAAAAFDGVRGERFFPGWGTPSLTRTWASVPAVIARFDGGNLDGFHHGWPGTSPHHLAWGGVADEHARFDGERVEAFRMTWPPI